MQVERSEILEFADSVGDRRESIVPKIEHRQLPQVSDRLWYHRDLVPAEIQELCTTRGWVSPQMPSDQRLPTIAQVATGGIRSEEERNPSQTK